MSDLTLSVDSLERERDFYYGKLRDIELLCQGGTPEELTPLIEKIKEILYATEEGFAPPVEGEDGVDEPEEGSKNGDYQDEY